MSDPMTPNERRARIGEQAILLLGNGSANDESAASDVIANILHAYIGEHWRQDDGSEARALLDRAHKTWVGDDEDDKAYADSTGITLEGLALGHRYVAGYVNAYCPQCSREQGITVLDCDYDLDK